MYFCCCCFWFGISFPSSFLFYPFANASLLLMFQASSSFDGMAGKAKAADVCDAFGLVDTMSAGDVLGKKSKKSSRKSSDPRRMPGQKGKTNLYQRGGFCTPGRYSRGVS